MILRISFFTDIVVTMSLHVASVIDTIIAIIAVILISSFTSKTDTIVGAIGSSALAIKVGSLFCR